MSSEQITEAEFNQKYAGTKLYFKSYYKYSFTFEAKLEDGGRVVANFGGNADDIYKQHVRANEAVDFEACENWQYVTLYDAAGKEIFAFENW